MYSSGYDLEKIDVIDRLRSSEMDPCSPRAAIFGVLKDLVVIASEHSPTLFIQRQHAAHQIFYPSLQEIVNGQRLISDNSPRQSAAALLKLIQPPERLESIDELGLGLTAEIIYYWPHMTEVTLPERITECDVADMYGKISITDEHYRKEIVGKTQLLTIAYGIGTGQLFTEKG